VDRSTFGPLIFRADANSRKSLISNAINLIRLCKGKNIVISSSALTVMDLRGPYDVINMYRQCRVTLFKRMTFFRACLFGLNQADAKACLTVNARAVLFHGGMFYFLHGE